jgi:CelD/BcsL family acetyltransferase involved in cellulose biosynthesis
VSSTIERSSPFFEAHSIYSPKPGQKEAAVSETYQCIDPLTDPRWGEFLQRHPRASIFHTPGWLEALWRTYGYVPVAFTTSRPGEELRNGLVFSRVQSWLIRPRLVSLPFSDHADPLLDDPGELPGLLAFLKCGQAERRWRSIELRPPDNPSTPTSWPDFHDGRRYFLHRLDLRASLIDLFSGLHKDSIQRKIRRAEREGLVCQVGRSETQLNIFYKLTVVTRRRQGLPPPPLAWFRNVLACLGERALIRVVFAGDRPIAAILTLQFKDTMVYKYGCSDARFHSLGGMPFVLWRTITDAKRLGDTELDLGRSDPGNVGLTTFKERFGAVRSVLTYKKYPDPGLQAVGAAWAEGAAKQVFGVLPERLQIAAGRLIYPHIG